MANEWPRPDRGKAIQASRGSSTGRKTSLSRRKVEGTISLKKNHRLILERSAVITAHVEVENITIKGQMNGNTVASSKVEITS